MLQESSGSRSPQDGVDTPSLVWEGPIIQQGVEFIIELADTIKAKAAFVRGYERWQFIPLNISTGEVDIKLLPANLLRVDILSRGSNFNKSGKSRWDAVYGAQEKWADDHPDGPHLELHINFARNHLLKEREQIGDVLLPIMV